MAAARDTVGSIKVPQTSGELVLTRPSTGDSETFTVERHTVKASTQEQYDWLLGNVPGAEPASSSSDDGTLPPPS